MSYDIITLVPNCYTKKSKKVYDFRDIDNFVEALRNKFSEWQIKGSFETKGGVAYKLKFDQVESCFLSKSTLVLYVVGTSSQESFRSSIEKVVTSCQEKERLEAVVVVSVDQTPFDQDKDVKVVTFDGSLWKNEEDSQWEVLENILKEKIQIVNQNNYVVSSIGKSLTLPVSIPRRKSPSKIKSFFNSLPAKFDIEKRRSSFKEKRRDEPFNESVPNIKVSELQDESIKNDKKQKDKEDCSKLSLNSIFKKRSRKARDSGLSMDSSNSNGSGSRKSETMGTSAHEAFDTTSEASPSRDKSPVQCFSTLEKTKTYKAKIIMFKNKANKVFHSASCLNSPENKHRKYAGETIFYDDDRLSLQMPIMIDGSKSFNLNSSSTNKFCDEPHLFNHEDSLQNGKIKHYSWDLNLEKDHENMSTDSCPSDQEELHPVIHGALKNDVNSSDISNDFLDDDIFTPDNIDSNIEEESSEKVDDKYFKVQYAPNSENNTTKSAKHSVTFKIDGLDSLDNIMDSIQKSCDELKIKSKYNNESSVILNSFKGNSESGSQVSKFGMENKSNFKNKDIFQEKNNKLEMIANETIEKPSSVMYESASLAPSTDECTPSKMPDSCIIPSSSLLHRVTKVIIGNPFVVISLLTATAITAPIWTTYIPYNMRTGDLFSLTSVTVSRIFNSEILRSFSGRFLPASISATATTRVLKGRIVASPESNFLFQSSKFIYG